MFTRLFGNTNTNNIPWGTIKENGVGKFDDFTPKALQEIKALGVTHLWLTGVLHHAVVTDYSAYGISEDDPDIVKGRAGSPYAIKDYYTVDPDLANNVDQRLNEFEALIKRAHSIGLKVIIDIVPNHVARHYKSLAKPDGVKDFGETDDATISYHINNNFYYNPTETFKVPQWAGEYSPLGANTHPLEDGNFTEQPAKWTGNGARASQPKANDWYETVKVNYGVTPEGKNDFVTLPDVYAQYNIEAHFEFWQDKTVPDSWLKFKDIALYWMAKGVDGFRYDMAEMVPVAFWSYMNSAIKHKNPNAFLLAEVYNPSLYRDYIKKGKMDYLYDKVQLYDTIKRIIQGEGSTDAIPPILKGLEDIEHHMLHFLENHDEQRLASPEFAGHPDKGKPAMVVSATATTAPTLLYFGQEVGEDGSEDAGFGKPSRTSIFDYIGVPAHQRWVNHKAFDGGQLTEDESALRDFYKRLLNLTLNTKALSGQYLDLHTYNRKHSKNYSSKLFAYARWQNDDKYIILTNFDATKSYTFNLKLSTEAIAALQLDKMTYTLSDKLYNGYKTTLSITETEGQATVHLEPLESFILKLDH